MDSKNKPVAQTIQLKDGHVLTLRQAVPADAERILVYVNQIAHETENIGFGPGEFMLTLEEEQAFLQKAAETPTQFYLLAEVAGEVAGSLTFQTGTRARTSHAGEFGITVIRKYWNLGIGNLMLTTFINWARQTDQIRKINLLVRVDNLPAIHLYEKHGFVQEGRLTRDFYLHGEFIDAYTMGLPIDHA